MLKHLLLLSLSLLVAPLLRQPVAAQALDPTFTTPAGLYAPGGVYTMAAQQADGKRVVAGYFSRVNNTAVGTLVRLDATGALDATFAQNVGVARNTFRVRALPNGQYMVSSLYGEEVAAGGLTRTALLRLNANGTADATFNAGAGAATATGGVFLSTFVGQPDGKLLVGGSFTAFSGQNTGGLVRLTTTGALDAAFTTNLGTGFNGQVTTVAVQPDGKLVVGGVFTALNGQPASPVLRLNADGTRDASFTSAIPSTAYISAVLVQPDGKLLVTGALGINATNTNIVRLTATGSIDTGFVAPPYPTSYAGSYFDNAVQLQPDGKVLFAGPFGRGSDYTVIRLNANGTLDNTFALANGLSQAPSSVGLQSDGSLWIGGYFESFNSPYAALGRLTSTGAIDAAFTPKIQVKGSVTAVVQQADGQLIMGGDFTELAGVAVNRVARLSAIGTPDVAFAAATGAVPGQVTALALQPDGKLLVGASSGLRRLLSTGSPDGSYGTFAAGSSIKSLAVQPDGKVIALGFFSNVPSTSSTQELVRLTASGDFDASFRPSITNGPGSVFYLTALALQPDGKVLVGGGFLPITGGPVLRIVRYESTGAVDASFSSSTTFELPANAAGALVRFNALILQPDGKVLAGGYFATVNGVPRTNLARLSATGQLDATFTPPATLTGSVTALALQPNGRVLVGSGYGNDASPTTTPLLRLLNTGASDPSFGTTASPDYPVTALLAQSNEAFIVGGTFSTISGQPAVGLARITAPNVLAATAPATQATHLAAWPVPAHELLHVAVEAGAQTIELLDVMGRRMVQRQGPIGAGELTLPTHGLPAGLYVLRVRYASGSITRQLAVE